MKKINLLLFVLFSAGLFAQENFNLELIANVNPGETGNDVWGYVDEVSGLEYAIMGFQESTRVYSLEDPTNPIERAVIPGPSSTWRDMKDHDDHIYVTTDQGGTTEGLVIIDMTMAPETITFSKWQPFIDFTDANGNNITGQLNTCHNIYIDENGIGYLAGCGGVGVAGVIMLDLNQDPKEPVVIGIENEFYSHDVFVRGDTLYSSEISANPGQLSIYDISDKTNPISLSNTVTSFSFCHNTWISDDGNYAFTTDERANANVDSYDISDLSAIERLDTYHPAETAGQGVIPHNTHYKDGFLITSWYTDGVVITDVHEPDIMVKVGGYDTFLGANGGFNGCWGAYPWLPSGHILASDRQTGLYVLMPEYIRATYLRGIVTDKANGMPISEVTVELQATQINARDTKNDGRYGVGIADAGTYDVTFNHPDYIPVTATVDLVTGETTFLDVEMEKYPTYLVNINTIKGSDLTPVADASVILTNNIRSFSFNTDGNGNYQNQVIEGTYDIYVGSWGYEQRVYSNVEITEDQDITLKLHRGYEDDFIFDLGWTVDGNAETGAWVRDVPIGTFGNDGTAVNVDADIDGDLGEECYMTGNGGGGAGGDDIDAGETVLTSDIMDLTWYISPEITYSLWFVNRGGQGGQAGPNDSLNVYITNGTVARLLESVQEDLSEWRPQSRFVLDGFIEITDQMQLVVVTGDYENGHIVESGFDQFKVEEGMPLAIEDIESLNNFSVFPNPFSNTMTIKLDAEHNAVFDLQIIDIHGKVVTDLRNLKHGDHVINADLLPSGFYIARVSDGSNTAELKLIKQ